MYIMYTQKLTKATFTCRLYKTEPKTKSTKITNSKTDKPNNPKNVPASVKACQLCVKVNTKLIIIRFNCFIL